MSGDADERIERLRAAMVAIEAGELEELGMQIEGFVHPDCEWSALIAVVQGRSYEGRAGMVAFFRDLVGSFNVKYVEPEFRAFGDDTVLLLTMMQLRGRESGIGMDQELGVVCEYEGRLLRRGYAYESHAAALEAAEARNA